MQYEKVRALEQLLFLLNFSSFIVMFYDKKKLINESYLEIYLKNYIVKVKLWKENSYQQITFANPFIGNL